MGSIELNSAIKTKQGDDQIIKQKCLILRSELKLGIVLLGEDFLMTNNVGIKYDSKTLSMLIDINDQRVTLLTDKMESNLKSYYPSTFLTGTTITQEPENSETPNTSVPLHATDDFDQEQKDLNEFFNLDPNPISEMSINSFLQ